MNRYFISDKESDTLIALATKLYGLKIGELINIALKNEFLPVTEPHGGGFHSSVQCKWHAGRMGNQAIHVARYQSTGNTPCL